MAQFTNQAQLRYGNAVANSNIAVGEILEVLSATKTAVRDNYGRGDSVTYVISIVNSGNTAFNGVTLNDNLGTYLYDTTSLTPLSYVSGTIRYYVNGALQPTPAVAAGPPLAVTGISIPAGGNAQIIYETAANEFAPLDAESSITNTATITGAGITPITVNETVNAVSEPMLTITKSVSPVPVTESGTLTYTFLIQNSGNTAADAALGAVVTDTFDPILSNLNVSFNGSAWTSPTDYTYDETTGIFSTAVGALTVPAATYSRDPVSGAWTVTPGVSTLTVSGVV